MTGALALQLIALLTTGVQTEAPELEAYRVFARSAATAQVVAAAREGMCSATGDYTPADQVALEWPAAPRPVYVTLVRGRTTRACVGTDTPMGTLAETVRALGGRVMDADRRRDPVRFDELAGLRMVIAFAGDGMRIADPYALDPAREGLKIETDRGAVAFLPGEARTVRWALSEARRIGVLAGPISEARFTRFPVVIIEAAAADLQPVLPKEPRP